MAIVNSPEALVKRANALRLVISDRAALAYNVTYPTLSYLTGRGVTQYARQKKVSWQADIGGADVVIKDVIEDAGTNAQGEMVPADLTIGNTAITHNFDIDLTEATQAAATASIDELKNLYQAHVNRGLIKMYREYNQRIFNGDGTKPSCRIVGLEKVVDNTFAYAGIDPTLYPGWRSIVDTAGTVRDLTPKLLRSFETKMMKAETNYDLIITSPELRETYMDLFDARRSFQIEGNARQAMIDLGIGDISYNGRPVVVDPACTPGTMYFIDSANLFLHSYRVKGDAENSGHAIKIGAIPTQNIYSERWEMGIIPQVQVFNRKSVNALQAIK